MTTRRLQIKAYTEWNSSSDCKCKYHTFEYYWFEKYARVYKLPSRLKSAGDIVH